MKIKKKIYFWASDICTNSGEGILANTFINKYSKKHTDITFENLAKNDKFQKKDGFHKNKLRFEKSYHKYIFPLIGVSKLWISYFSGKKICFINYLPLWNFLIFLLLPPNTILGPITGSIQRKLLLLKIFTQFEKISLYIIKKRYSKIYFSHNFFIKKYNLNSKNYKGNFILEDFKFKKKNNKKKYDFIIYFRKNSKLNKDYIYNLLNLLNDQKFRIVVIGDKINHKNIKNLGYLSRIKTQKIISETRFAIANPENLYSYFVQDCLSMKLIVFYNHYFKKYNIFTKKLMIPIFFQSHSRDFNIIKKTLRT